MAEQQIQEEIVTTAQQGILDPQYTLRAGHLLSQAIEKKCAPTFLTYFKQGVALNRLDPQYLPFVEENEKQLRAALNADVPYFSYFAVNTLQKSYLLRDGDNNIIESVRYLFLRVAIGINAPDLSKVLETFHLLHNRVVMHATPTLFNAATVRPQLSSCYLMQIEGDSIDGIFNSVKDAALISKYAGGLGIHAHHIRAKGTFINGTGGVSNGLCPMIQTFNATARYVDQGGGKRKGSFAMYLEPWHADIFEFLNLRRPHGDPLSKALDLFYALWIPDLFMQRVQEDGKWTLFCPHKCKGLCDVHSEAFETLYQAYEKQGAGNRVVRARDLWNDILASQTESGTPFMLYKDSCNRKSNQQHLGTIKSSNLCTEIVLYSSAEETAVCNLASLALPAFCSSERFDYDALGRAIRTLVRNLNNVIDRNHYPTPKTSLSNFRHRPVGIGVQGYHNVMMIYHLPYESEGAKQLGQKIFECMYFHAVDESCRLATVAGPHESFPGSPASEGTLQFDLWGHTPSKDYDWAGLKERVKEKGLRNSTLIAPMPTASTSNICQNTEGTDVLTSNLYTRHTLAGNFIVLNQYLVKDLKILGMWNDATRRHLKQNEGSVQTLPGLPKKMKDVYKTVYEIGQKHHIDHNRARAPFVCQSQSMNLTFPRVDPNKLSSAHFYAWKSGLKTGMYYLRSKPASESMNVEQDEGEECLSCGS
jgi:ribonucleoside-diphosphate reductase alpha chain